MVCAGPPGLRGPGRGPPAPAVRAVRAVRATVRVAPRAARSARISLLRAGQSPRAGPAPVAFPASAVRRGAGHHRGRRGAARRRRLRRTVPPRASRLRRPQRPAPPAVTAPARLPHAVRVPEIRTTRSRASSIHPSGSMLPLRHTCGASAAGRAVRSPPFAASRRRCGRACGPDFPTIAQWMPSSRATLVLDAYPHPHVRRPPQGTSLRKTAQASRALGEDLELVLRAAPHHPEHLPDEVQRHVQAQRGLQRVRMDGWRETVHTACGAHGLKPSVQETTQRSR